MIQAICPQCKKEFKTYPYRFKMSKNVFCSHKCMSDSYRLPPEVARRRKLKWQKLYRENNQDKIQEYRKKNRDKLRSFAHDYYLKYKEEFIENAKKQYKKRNELYHTDKNANLYENIKVSKWASQKRKKNRKWAKLIDEKTREREAEYQEETMDSATLKGRPWTEGEIQYLENSRGKKNYVEMALHLNRTFSGVKAALTRLKIPRASRILKDKYNTVKHHSK